MKKILSLTVLFTFSLTIFSQGLDPDEKLNMPLVWGKNQAVWINKTIGKIDLNSNEAIFDENLQETEDFCLGKDNLITVYGRGNEPARKFFDEHLPAIFKRTIDFTKFDPGNNGELWWIFTGDQGGFTVLIKNNRIDLVQRYYNSFGLNDFSGDSVNAKRFPQKETVNTSVEFDGKIRTVSIEITHEMQIYMYINGYLAARQLCLLDISRHQLKCTSKQSDICGTMYKPVAQPADFEIFSSEKKQTILGFGGITSVPAFNLLSEEGKKQWWKYIQEYKLLLHREYPIGTNLNENMDNWDNVHDAVPHYYADNFNNSEISDFEYIKKIRGMDGIVIFEFWILPDWAVTIDEDYKEHTKWNVRIPIIEKYCEAMINYCKTSVEKTGKAPEIVGIQNEVPQSDETWQQMSIELRKALDENGFADVKIHMSNPGVLKHGIHAAKAFSANDNSWKAIDYSASNMYDYQEFYTHPDGYDKTIKEWNSITSDKEYLSTEICINMNLYQKKTYRTAFQLGQLYHKNMVDMNAIGIMYCWNILNVVQPSFAKTRTLFTIDRTNNFIPVPAGYTLRTYGAFSRYILKDMQRIEIDNANPDLLVSVYSNETQQTMVILNRSAVPKIIQPNSNEYKFTRFERCSPYFENKSFNLDSEEITIKGGEIVTFYN